MRNASQDNSDPKQAGQGAAPAQEQPAASAPGEAETPEAIIAALRAETADLKDKLLRAHAEVENIRKRAEREREDTAKYGIARLARDILGVGDNFQRAIDAVPAGAAEQDPALKSFIDGVTMIERELLNTLERYGIKRMQAINEPFNPHLHQAVMEVPKEDVPAGTIVQVFQPGFTIEDRVLRPAMVAVSSGGPKPPPATNPPANENAPTG
jgi:molecular chaperone GrpE